MKMDLSEFFDLMENYYEFSGEIDKSEVDFPDREIKIVKPIEYKGEIFVLDGGEMNIHFDVDFTYEEPCSRCLKPSIKTKSTVLSGKLIEGREDDYEESEDEEQEDIIFFENNKLDISYYIKSQVYLSVPMQTLCKADCKGLCSTCGTDFNEGECDCTQDNIDPRLAKLKDFFPKE